MEDFDLCQSHHFVTKGSHEQKLTQDEFYQPKVWLCCRISKQTLLVLKLTAIILLTACLQVSAKGYSQKITLSVKDAPLEQVFKSIEKQSGYYFNYNNTLIKQARPVTVQVKDADLMEVLKVCFKDQPFTYAIVNRLIVVKDLERKTEVNFQKEDNLLTIYIKGRVVNEKGEPLEGVTVTVKGTTKSTTTDANGQFSLATIESDEILVFTHVSMESFELKVSGKTELVINLKTKMSALGDVQVVANTGYQMVKPNEVTGSLSVIDNKTLNQQLGSNILNRLDGVVSGVSFPKPHLQNGPIVMIRGLSSILGPKNPLIIVNNFPYDGDINNINPNDVESITVLKDAAAASIWGTRAGNGVIVINTKSGRFNQPLKVEINNNILVTNKPKIEGLRTISSDEYIEVEKYLFNQGHYDQFLNDTWNYPAVSPVVEILDKERAGLINSSDAEDQINKYRNFNIKDQYKNYIYQKGLHQQYSVNVHGGSNNLSYFLSAGYDKSFDNLDFKNDRITVRSNNLYKPIKDLQVSVLFQYSQIYNKSGKPGGYGDVAVGRQWVLPYLSFVDTRGFNTPFAIDYRRSYTDTAGAGKLLNWEYYPLDDYKHNSTINNQHDFLANFGINYQIAKWIVVDLKYLYEEQNRESKNFQDAQSYSARNLINRFSQIDPLTGNVTYIIPMGGVLNYGQRTLESHNLRGQINISRAWRKHIITAIAGSEIRSSKITGSSNTAYGYNDENMTNSSVDLVNQYPNYINGDMENIPGGISFINTVSRFISTFANAAYTYNSKYTFSLSGRRDASNLFGVKLHDKWTPLWSSGLGWEVSKESFYKLSQLPYLKVRVSLGYSGNTDLNRSGLTSLVLLGPLSPSNYPVSRVNQFENPELRWEKIKMYNFAIDFDTRNNYLSGSIEAFLKKGIDLFGSAPVEPTTGLNNRSTIIKNVANIKGKGVDITLNINAVKNDKFKWKSTLLFSFNEVKTTKYYVDSNLRSGSFVSNGFIVNPIEGQNLHSIVGFHWGGLDENGNPQGYIGKALSTDYNEIVYNSRKEELVYKPALPIYFGSIINTLSWKSLTLTININYRFRYYFMKPSIYYSSFFYSGANIGTSDFSKRWQQPGDELKTNVPSMIYPEDASRDALYNYSETLITKADNIKLQYINLSYDFNNKRFKNKIFNALQLYVNASNLGILWRANKDKIDPDFISEIPLNGKVFSAGVKMAF